MVSIVNVSRLPIASSKSFWVVRAGKDADFYQHFRRNNVIAIGHTLDLDVGNIKGELSNDDKSEILRLYKANLTRKSDNKAYVSRQVGQVRQFIELIKVGDTILTITENRVLAGLITSKCYYDETSIELNESNNDEDCFYPLRYSVEWGKTQAREYIPYIIDKSFRNSGTVFRLSDDDKIKALNHWLNPIHFLEGEVRCSVNIRSENMLSNRKLTNLSSVYDQLEMLASYFDSLNDLSDANIISFNDYIQLHKKDFEYQLTAQHAFMSPGHQFIQLKGSNIKNTAFALAFAFIFNSQIVFAEEEVGDNILREKVIELAQVIKTPEAELSIRDLKAGMPKQVIQDVEFDIPEPSDDAML
jgi:predicted Mrr-cat superfamily restriction endonuclease